MEVSVKRLNYSQIRTTAENFLDKYHPTLSMPVPIEKIAELILGINVVTIPDMKSIFEIDGFINSTFTQITIDDDIFNSYEERARFTIAHEIGHKILHSEIYKNFRIGTLEDYLGFQNKISEDNQKWLEIQANIFAACTLVPSASLKEEFSKALKEEKLPRRANTEYFIPYLEQLPSKFNVSWGVLYRRMQKEGLITA